MIGQLGEETMPTTSPRRSNPILDHFRCPNRTPHFIAAANLREPSGFFRFGQNVVCYGRAAGQTSTDADGDLFDASQHVQRSGSMILLPFDVNQVLDNLRYERYVNPSGGQRWIEMPS